MNIRKSHALLAAALLPALPLLLSCSKQAPPPQAAAPPPSQASPVPDDGDTSTPKKVSLAFVSALVAGDIPGMRALATGTGGQVFTYYSGLADLVASQHIFVEALRAKFGDTCSLPPEIEHLGNLPPMPANYDQLAEKIDGDTATLVDPAGHAGVKLKKVDGAWKVDLDSADAALPPGVPERMAAQQQQFATIKKGFNQATAKILDGTYTDCKTALADVMAVVKPQQ